MEHVGKKTEVLLKGHEDSLVEKHILNLVSISSSEGDENYRETEHVLMLM